jgi:hypothetical protein
MGAFHESIASYVITVKLDMETRGMMQWIPNGLRETLCVQLGRN